jgi:hypothetical protein
MVPLLLALATVSALFTQNSMLLKSEDCECSEDLLGDGYCDHDCNNKYCNYDEYDCCNADCSYGCSEDQIGDGECDEGCNNKCCEYDAGDCEE